MKYLKKFNESLSEILTDLPYVLTIDEVSHYVDELKPIKENVQDEQLWEFITQNEFLNRESVHGKDLSFDINDKSKIRSGIKNDGYDYSVSISDKVIEIEITNYDKSDGNKKFILCILKSPDDWFYCKEYYYYWYRSEKTSVWRQQPYNPEKESEKIYESYIKCDTIEGLIEYIKSRREYLYTL